MTTHVFKPDMPPPGNRIGIVAWARAEESAPASTEETA